MNGTLLLEVLMKRKQISLKVCLDPIPSTVRGTQTWSPPNESLAVTVWMVRHMGRSNLHWPACPSLKHTGFSGRRTTSSCLTDLRYRVSQEESARLRRVFLVLKYADITQNTYIQSWTVMEIMAREVWNFDRCYTLVNYQIHIKTGRNMWFL
jgi:hypothetical protein